MGQQRLNQKKTAAPTHPHPTKTSVKSPVHPEEELQGAIGNREMGRLMETNRLPHPSSPFPKLQGELPLLGGMMPVSQATIQRQPLFRGLSQELAADTAMALPATGAVIQPKLTLGTPGDMYEQEADRVARQVVDEIHSSPFREQNALSEEERKPAGGEAGRVQRQITVRSAGDAGGELSTEWEGELQRAKSGGQPLSPSVKEPMERAFGVDFGGVRVHTGAQADGLARSIQAKAFTTGQDVFFRQGAYEPGSGGGMELIAHELTHVLQQGEEVVQRYITIDGTNRIDSLIYIIYENNGLIDGSNILYVGQTTADREFKRFQEHCALDSWAPWYGDPTTGNDYNQLSRDNWPYDYIVIENLKDVTKFETTVAEQWWLEHYLKVGAPLWNDSTPCTIRSFNQRAKNKDLYDPKKIGVQENYKPTMKAKST